MNSVSVKNLLLKGASKKKLLISFLGLTIGLVAVVFCVQLFTVIDTILGESKKKEQFEYLQVNKKIGYGTTLGFSSANFSDTEINQLVAQDFIKDAGKVIANNFQVSIEGGIGIPFYTELFLQAVPNKFLDIDSSGFIWKGQHQEVPIVVSTNFYNLYNHGFAPSQGLPSLPKSALKQKSFVLKIRGEKGKESFRCRIYGYSDRINSILVPHEFLTWANKKHTSKAEEVSMLIVEVEDTGDKRLANYFEKKSYSVNKERLSFDNTKSILKAVLYVFAVLGVVVLLMSLLMLLSFSQLLIVQNQQEISVLRILGYSKKRLANSLFKAYLNYLFSSIGFTLVVLMLVFYFLQHFLMSFNFKVSFINYESILCFLGLVGAIVILIYVNIFKYLKNSKSIEI